MSRFDATTGLYTPFVQDTKAMGDAIEALERHTATLSNLCRDRLADITRLDERVRNIAADLSRVEQRTAPKPAPLADGEYLVRWREDGNRELAKVVAGQWLEELGMRDGLPLWTDRKDKPHWIGPRVDMREG